jgi:Steigviridae/Suoliviridae L,D-carboxypeptidase/transpeptidase
MKLRVERDTFTDKSTIGTFYIDGEQFAWSLELPVRDGLPGSAIPTGVYKVIAYQSPHFGRLMPLLVDVPGRSEIEIHWLNTPDETRGCIGIGGTRPGKDFIGNSRIIFDDFWFRAQDAIEAGTCTIEVTQPNNAQQVQEAATEEN